MSHVHAWEKVSPESLTAQIAELRAALNRTADALREAEHARQRAEQSARDAWMFAKGLIGTGRQG